jgi:glycosyl transferase family 25
MLAHLCKNALFCLSTQELRLEVSVSLNRSDLATWLINLPRATERRAKMEAQLASLPFNHRVFDGIDGKARETELLEKTDIAAFERNMGRKILIGGIGCYNSHLEVWREFLASGKQVALVIEDDVVFHDDFIEAIDLALEAQVHWDFLKLNCIRAKLPVPQGKIGLYTLNAYVGPATGTGAYLIKRETAERMLPKMLPVTRATDHEINRFFLHDFRLFGLEPFPSHVDDGNVSYIAGVGHSDLKKFRWFRRLPNYRLRLGNYFRRFIWLAKNGFWPGSRRYLQKNTRS